MNRKLVVRALAALALLGGCSAEVTVGSQEAYVKPARVADAAQTDDRYVVVYKDAARADAALKAAGAKVVRELRSRSAVAARIPGAAVQGLLNNPHIESIELDARRFPTATGDVAVGGETIPYGIPMVQADQLAEGATPRKICIIDSGYYTGHEDLSGNNVTGSPAGWNDDACGHGTHVAGTIAALQNDAGVRGTLPGSVDLHVVQVFTGADCAWTYSSDLAAALDDCMANGADVVSMSLGGSRSNRVEKVAFQQAFDAGVLSIAAAGNDGNTRNSYPASYDSVVSVAALDHNKAHADFSQRNAAVEIAAPGVAVLSTVPFDGTHELDDNGTVYAAGSMDGSPSGSVSGALVDGGLCDAVVNAPGAIVLCQRGSINFSDKVLNAQAGGAAAAVVYNNVDGAFGGTLAGVATTIPSITLTQVDGEYLVAQRLGATVTITTNTVFPASGYEAWDGTSMATPHVSGVAALVWSHFPDATNADVRAALTTTAEDLGDAGRDALYGFGLVQAAAAYDWLAAGNSGGGGGDTGGGGGMCTDLGQAGDACVTDGDCCSNRCKGRPGNKTCG